MTRFILSLAALASVSACAAIAPAIPAAGPAVPPVVLRGEARDIAYQDLDGQRHQLSEQRGKFVVLMFFAHWCPICQHEMPLLQAFASEFKDKNLAVVPVESTGVGVDTVKPFQAKIAPGLPLFLDPSLGAPAAYLVENYPTFYLISPDFVAQERQQGLVPIDYFKARYDLYTKAWASRTP